MEKPEVTADVIVPGLQSLITGALVALATAVVMAVAIALTSSSWGGWHVAAGALAVGTLTTWLTWRGLLDDRRPLPAEPAPEKRVNLGKLAANAPEVKLRLRVEEDNGHTLRYGNLPINERALRKVARGVCRGQSFAVSVWSGRGKPLTRSEFEQLRGWLLQHDYLRWRDPRYRQLGMEFTSKGRALLKALSED